MRPLSTNYHYSFLNAEKSQIDCSILIHFLNFSSRRISRIFLILSKNRCESCYTHTHTLIFYTAPCLKNRCCVNDMVVEWLVYFLVCKFNFEHGAHEFCLPSSYASVICAHCAAAIHGQKIQDPLQNFFPPRYRCANGRPLCRRGV